MKSFNTTVASIFFLFLFSVISLYALTPNPIISRNKTVYGAGLNNSSNLVNGKFGESAWILANNSWAAIDLGQSYSKILFIWNSTNYMWSDSIASPECAQNRGLPRSYDISISSNSTNGSDGDWTKFISVTDNIVSNRPHLIEGNSIRWIKMSIINTGECQIDELEAFDVSKGMEDTWLFLGTSITANAFKGTVPEKNYSDLVTEKHRNFTPAIVRGGIGCIKSIDFARDFPKYLKAASTMHFWAIEMGTNDGYGGFNGNVETLKTSLQQFIDSCKTHGIVPVLARAMGTNKAAAGWQIDTGFVKAIDDLTISNELIEGPDYYTHFSTHPSDLAADGVHPSASGGQTMQRLWAENMDFLYNETSIKNMKAETASASGNRLSVVKIPGIRFFTDDFKVYTIDGRLHTGRSLRVTKPAHGVYILKSLNGKGTSPF